MNRNNKVVILIAALFAMTVLSQDAWADASDGNNYLVGSAKKLGRGLHDVVFCFGEMAYRFEEANEDAVRSSSHHFGQIPTAFFIGIGHTVKRAVVGVFEVATFFVPQDPILTPEFLF